MIVNKILRDPNGSGFTRWIGAVEILPGDYKQGEILPVIIFASGLGEMGNGTSSALDKLFTHGIPKELKAGRVLPKRAIVLCPQVDGWFNDVSVRLTIEFALAKYKVGKVSVTGLSNGCLFSCLAAYNHGDKISSVVVCAMRPHIGIDKSKVKGLPFWVCNNYGDLPNETDKLIADLKANGALVKTTDKTGASTIWSGDSHDSWTRTYKMDEVYEYLLSIDTTPSTPPTLPPVSVEEDVTAKLTEIQTQIKDLQTKFDSIVTGYKITRTKL